MYITEMNTNSVKYLPRQEHEITSYPASLLHSISSVFVSSSHLQTWQVAPSSWLRTRLSKGLLKGTEKCDWVTAMGPWISAT